MYFIPNVISTTAIAFLWYFIYHVDVGLLNNMLNAVGLKKLTHAWLNDPTTAPVVQSGSICRVCGVDDDYLYDAAFDDTERTL